MDNDNVMHHERPTPLGATERGPYPGRGEDHPEHHAPLRVRSDQGYDLPVGCIAPSLPPGFDLGSIVV